MKRIKILCAAGLAMLMLNGCGGRQGQMESISVEKAKELALTASGLSASQVEFTAADLSERSGQNYYRVEFTASGGDYYYDIDALTGVVIDAKTPAGTSNGDGALHESAANADTDKTAGADGAAGADTAAGMITDQEAKARALAHAGLTEAEVTFVKSSLDYEDGSKVYEVEFYTDGNKEYDYDIDAFTGEVISYDYDAESVSLPSTDGGSRISEQEAKELALSQVPGASERDIREFETDYDDGRTEYEGKIVYNGMEYEFEIDGYSGAFRSWEAEPLD